MAITPLPSAPSPTDTPAQFNTKAFNWVAALGTWTTETNAVAVEVDADRAAAAASESAAASSESAAAASALLAEDWASKVNGQVATTDYSAKAYAIGGTGVTDGDGAAKEWAIKTSGTVDGSEFSAKYYSGLSEDWANKTTGTVDGSEYSAKYYAQSALNAPGTSATSTTSLTIAGGPQSLTIQTGKAFSIGQFVIIARTSAPSDYMTGQITAHDDTTGALTVNVTQIVGTGTYSEWTISLTAAGGGGGGAVTSGRLLFFSGF